MNKTFKQISIAAKRIRYDAQPDNVRSPGQAVAMARTLIGDSDYEAFFVVPVDIKNRPLGIAKVAQGGVDHCPVDIREVFRPCIVLGASGCFVVHNHPSGDPLPSSEDIALTARVKEAGELLHVPLLDHLIITDNSFCSLAERGDL